MDDKAAIERTRLELGELAYYLARQRLSILAHWREVTENASDLSVAASLTDAQFIDHIPGVLNALADRLRAWPEESSRRQHLVEREQVSGHGLQRWQQGYQLRELTREWGYLQICLMEVLETYTLENPNLDPQVMPTARRALTRLCCDGISESSTQFWRLHQAEAAGHVADLEQALATLSRLDRARAEAWREAAHDLRGGLTVVKTASSMLDDNTDPVKGEFFDLLQKGVGSLQDMLADLMSLARLEAGHERRVVAPFDAGGMLGDFCRSSTVLAEQRGLFLRMEGPESMMVEGDRVKVLRIAQNLLLNALKYTEHGGITVTWGPDEADAGSWMFHIQDTGPGLDAGPGAPLAHQIYDATQTAHEAEDLNRSDDEKAHNPDPPTCAAESQTLPAHQQPGEGVGLSIVKRLCELLDASLELETSPGRGSTFRVVLPRHYQG